MIDKIDALIERNYRILKLETARPRNVMSLQNWINGNGCVAREETAYLARSEELASVADTDDTVMTWLETIVEDSLTRLCRCLGMVGTYILDDLKQAKLNSIATLISHEILTSIYLLNHL